MSCYNTTSSLCNIDWWNNTAAKNAVEIQQMGLCVISSVTYEKVGENGSWTVQAVIAAQSVSCCYSPPDEHQLKRADWVCWPA